MNIKISRVVHRGSAYSRGIAVGTAVAKRVPIAGAENRPAVLALKRVELPPCATKACDRRSTMRLWSYLKLTVGQVALTALLIGGSAAAETLHTSAA